MDVDIYVTNLNLKALKLTLRAPSFADLEMQPVLHVCECTCLYVCMYVCMYVYVCIYLYIHIYVYISSRIYLEKVRLFR